jgi:addiction module antidote protein, HigA family
MLPVMSEMHNPAHPGEVFREYLPEDMSVTDAAKAMNVTRQALSALLNGRSGVSADMALRLEAALGVVVTNASSLRPLGGTAAGGG